MKFNKVTFALFGLCFSSGSYANFQLSSGVCHRANDVGVISEDACASANMAAFGFDNNRDQITDTQMVNGTASFATSIPSTTNYINGFLGGLTAPQAYFPQAAKVFTDQAKQILVGSGSYENPQSGSALSHRNVLFATSGDGANALEAFYTNAIAQFTPNLQKLLAAEEQYRMALRVDPNQQDALDGLLEVYYARAEGFTLIGNDFMAKAYRNKFDRGPSETRSITEMEISDINNALTAYSTGFEEYMKLFQANYVGLDAIEKNSIAINAAELFFTPRLSVQDGPLQSMAAIRGQSNVIGNATAFRSSGESVGVVQGSPSIGMNAEQASQVNLVTSAVKFLTPVFASQDLRAGGSIALRFNADINETADAVELLIEFDPERLSAPASKDDITLGSAFDGNSLVMYAPGSTYTDNSGKQKILYANQFLLTFNANAPINATGLTIATVPFSINGDVPEPVDLNSLSAYVAGSGGSLLSGYKDVSLLFKLMAEHAKASAEKAKREFHVVSKDVAIASIDAEIELIGGWFEHIQALTEMAGSAESIRANEQLQNQIREVVASLNGLGELKGYLLAETNEYGYPDDYVPFYNGASEGSFAAIANLLVGNFESGTPGNYGGIFGRAREYETAAIRNKETWLDTKDRIRNELFVINRQAEDRLVQIVGRVDSEGNASSSPDDEIDLELKASHVNPISELGQQVLLLEKAEVALKQTQADIDAHFSNIELEKKFLQDALVQHDKRVQIIDEYGDLQANLDKEMAKIAANQAMLNAAAQAAQKAVKPGFGKVIGSDYASMAITLANGVAQADLIKKRGDLQAQKTRLAADERIKLAGVDTEIFKLQQTKNIDQMINQLAVKQISAELAAIDIQLALGRLNKLISERDELMAQRNRAIANLGEMSFADPTFRLTQFNAMRKASISLDLLKRWLYLTTRSFYYTWALDDNATIPGSSYTIKDIARIQVVGAVDENAGVLALSDTLSATDYIQALFDAHNNAPLRLNLSAVPNINYSNTNNTARYSLREDYLHLVMNELTMDELTRVRTEFRQWLNACDQYDIDNNCVKYTHRNVDGDLVIEFDTLGHLENYNNPVDSVTDVWKNFALRSYNNKPLWNHKIDSVGVALKAVGTTFTSGNNSVAASIEYGGTGFVKGNSSSSDDFQAFSMRQWRKVVGANPAETSLEPIDLRTIALSVPSSSRFENDFAGGTWLSTELRERPVVATRWRLIISASQLANIELNNLEDIYIYINSSAYQSQ